MKLENTFRKSFTAALKGHFGALCYVQKNHGNAFSAGLVDIEVVLRGKVYFIELKATKEEDFRWKELTRLQLETLRQLTNAGACAYVLVYFKGADSIAKVPFSHADIWVRHGAVTDVNDLIDGGCVVEERPKLLGHAPLLQAFLAYESQNVSLTT